MCIPMRLHNPIKVHIIEKTLSNGFGQENQNNIPWIYRQIMKIILTSIRSN